jgi:hypothetical protein
MKIIRQKLFSVGGLYRFPPSTSNQTIIDHILSDFALKLYGILKFYEKPGIGCHSLDTYQIFNNFWKIDDGKNKDWEEIYSEIPSQIIATKIEELSGGEIKEKDVTSCFGGGEFPIVKIYKLDPKSNGEGRNEIHATYDIMR